MQRFQSELTDAQWAKIERYLPPIPRGCGGPRPIDNRRCFEGILWVLRSGARWKDLPPHFPSPSTCWRRLQYWESVGAWLKAWRGLLREMDRKALLDWEETFSDGSFAPAKKGAPVLEKPSAARVRSGWWWSTAKVFLWEASLPRHRRPK